MESFDYIIVGAGTAGCILANRLTKNPENRVLMIEAGGEKDHFWVPIPAGFSKLLTNPQHNWQFTSEPEPNTLHRAIAVPRGKGLGGSTLINGMIYVRGQPQDYDYWEQIGAKGWGAKDVLPYFEKLENYAGGGVGRGTKGPMHVCEVAERHPLAEGFIEAAAQLGIPLNPDYNSDDQFGVGYYQVLQHKGRRWSVRDGYLKPAQQRTNLTICTDAHVLRLNVNANKICESVTYLKNGQTHTVKANKEVLLCAGAIQSPQILELSGIGAPDLLHGLGIDVVHALPGVGENYIDHFCTRMNWRVKGVNSLNELTRGWHLVKSVAEYFTSHTGILTLGTGLTFGFVKSRPELEVPDVQYFFVHASYANAAERKLDRLPGMTLGVAQLRPQSVGSIHIQTADPFMQPRIKPNFLASEIDQQSLIGGMEVARKIMEQPSMAKYVESEMTPGLAVQSQEEWLTFAREDGQTIYHPIGTCKIGAEADPFAVVDERLKVKGIQQLRVVDASVIPAMISGNTQAAVMMVAEKAADLILEDAL